MITFSHLKLQKRRVWQLFALYCCVLFYIVFFTPNRFKGSDYQPNLIPVWQTVERIHITGGEHFWPYYIGYWGNIFGNIILFLPFGFLLNCLYPHKSRQLILLCGFLTSVSIELLQLLLQIGVCDIDDVILNTLGTFCGVYILKWSRLRVYRG